MEYLIHSSERSDGALLALNREFKNILRDILNQFLQFFTLKETGNLISEKNGFTSQQLQPTRPSLGPPPPPPPSPPPPPPNDNSTSGDQALLTFSNPFEKLSYAWRKLPEILSDARENKVIVCLTQVYCKRT